MGISAAHASAFYDEVLGYRTVWAISDVNGYPAPRNGDGHRSMPFWSAKSRAERITASLDAYKEFSVVSIALDEWRSRWLPGLDADGILVGLNWSGTHATGYDVAPTEVMVSLSTRELR
ncbi:DUF2750 domain-containing protein [Arthrobacter livingstonensis]|uniref:DUF2750 domain-containing protein n=1 Tax=Arthrobacter livingstonensis TaxID=670078 RepID=A0A2V5L9F7_9MICC|nr:DUF2750 domain-containing protein [Arthrobacter livingstonensis]PYI66323.1 DUF2750 domain-containing protein [Arthrobacter livingstonensis]